jgi:phenylacetate-CoA ligase
VLSPHFQCVLTRPHRLDELTIRVESRTPLSPEDAASVAERVAKRAKATTGASVTFDVLPPWALERSVGKMRRILDER